MLKIATWNINSVRLRIELVKDFLARERPDILCLQETKTQDETFPFAPLREMGWEHIFISGEKSYNGVAIISRIPLANMRVEKFVNDDKRHIAATLPNGTELHNIYIPAGGDIPDAAQNPKFSHKLKFCDEVAKWFNKNRSKADKLIVCGDFNIAPLPHDVWSHKQLLTVVSHTPIEVEKLGNLKKSLEWIDTSREFTPHDTKLYSWWSYRNQDWRKSDRGRRLDHIWITKPLKPSLKNGYILKDMRDTKQPSDHVPVIAELI